VRSGNAQDDCRRFSSSSVTARGAKGNVGLGQRARRFAVRLPVKYRELGATAWREGTTVNISSTGVLFEAAEALAPQMTIDMAVTLPAALRGAPPAEVVGRGTVVRSTPMPDSAIVGASVRHYRIVRREQDESSAHGTAAEE
jgi:PilZ domain